MSERWRKSEPSPAKRRGRGGGSRGRGAHSAPTRTTGIVPTVWKDLGNISEFNERQLSQLLDSLNTLSYPVDGLDEQV
jgi:hypothetical protein